MKVVVVAHARSGSNSLVEILQAHPDVGRIENEPFNDRYATWDATNKDYAAQLRSGASFDGIRAELFACADGLKTLSYQLPDNELMALTHSPNVRVVTLRRRNLLQTAISQAVAMTTDLWQAWNATKPLESYYADIGALDVAAVGTFLEWTKREVVRTQHITADVDALHLRYEDLYLSPTADKLRTVDALWRFLDLAPAATPEMRHFLSPAVQQARPSTYGRIANLAAIEAELGSDEWGHVAIGTE